MRRVRQTRDRPIFAAVFRDRMHRTVRTKAWVLALAGAFPTLMARAQCGPLISSFPYNEGFEAGPAWTSGGNGNDWAWGTPAHPTINSAGGGSKSWSTGGLTGSFYNLGELSWLESPCFDFTGLTRPWVSFKIFWECERQYDGMTFQYSTDGGYTYSNVGTVNDPVDCLNQFWFNSSNITNLTGVSPKHGWSGRVGPTQGSCQGGSGSGDWVTASHCMTDLAGAPSVRFRFLFGAGTQCNDFDGIAIDDILIQNSELPSAAIGYTCTSATAATFTDNSTGCITSRQWNFGDLGSGASNFATGAQVTHTFSQPGTYTVTLVVNSPCAQPESTTQEITILDATVTADPASCGQSNGAVEVTLTNAPAGTTYLWNPGGAATAQVQDLAAGAYDVTVSAPNSCDFYGSTQVTNTASDLQLQPNHTDATCNGSADGTAGVTATGSGTPFSYVWTPNVSSGPNASALSAGDYSVEVTDANGCDATETITVGEPAAVTVQASAAVNACAGTTLTLTATANGGTGPYSYAWSPNGPEVSPLDTTTYQVQATDANGCTSALASTTVNIGSALQPTLTTSDTTGCRPHCATFDAGPAGMTSYAFTYGDGGADANAAHCYQDAGSYDVTLTVTDAGGCTGTITVPQLIHVLPTPEAAFDAPAVLIISDAAVTLQDRSIGAEHWSWDLGAAGTSEDASPLFTPSVLGCAPVTQTVYTDDGCYDSISVEICVEDEYALYVPNTFTPNDDGMNDVFQVITSVGTPSFYRLLLFDRWGSVIFTAEKPGQFWDGSGTPEGLYAWTLEMRDSRDKLHKERGHVLLLR